MSIAWTPPSEGYIKLANILQTGYKPSCEEISRFREETRIPVLSCKSLLEIARGDFEKAKDINRQASYHCFSLDRHGNVHVEKRVREKLWRNDNSRSLYREVVDGIPVIFARIPSGNKALFYCSSDNGSQWYKVGEEEIEHE